MLKVPAEFPEVGSYALYDQGGTHILARIVGKPPRGEGEEQIVLLAFPQIQDVASGNKRVPLADLIDATPLAKADRDRIEALEREMSGLAKNGRAWSKRRAEADALRLREIRSQTLDTLIARLPQRLRPAA